MLSRGCASTNQRRLLSASAFRRCEDGFIRPPSQVAALRTAVQQLKENPSLNTCYFVFLFNVSAGLGVDTTQRMKDHLLLSDAYHDM